MVIQQTRTELFLFYFFDTVTSLVDLLVLEQFLVQSY